LRHVADPLVPDLFGYFLPPLALSGRQGVFRALVGLDLLGDLGVDGVDLGGDFWIIAGR
jgi:hypothetical protein